MIRGWEDTEHLQLLGAVTFLRAAPNMSQVLRDLS